MLIKMLAAITIAIAWILFNWPALYSLHVRWAQFDEAYAIGYPAVLLSCGWIARHRQLISRHRQQTTTGLVLALLLFVGVLLIGAAAGLVQLQLLQQLVALMSLWLVLTTLLGWSVGRVLWFPFVMLLPAIPVWDFAIDPLRALTVLFSQHMLDWLAIPAHVDGFRITLPAGVIEVAGGCSGQNLFLAMMLVGLMFTESPYLTLGRRLAIVVLAAITGVIDNWIRVFLLVVIAYRTEMHSDLVYHHGSFGWWIFVISLMPYLWLAARIERGGAHVEAESPVQSVDTPLQSVPRFVGASTILVVLMLTVRGGVYHFEHRHGLATRGLAAPVGAIPVTPNWLPQYSGQDVTQTWHLQSDTRIYDLSAMTFLEQKAEKKLIYFSNRIASEDATIRAGRMAITPNFSVNTAVIAAKGTRYVWWFWWVDGHTATSALQTKLLQLRANLLGDSSAALIVLSLACNDANCPPQIPAVDDGLRQILLSLQQLHAAQ